MQWTVVGLGNPGEAYDGTRHNVGRRVVREYAAAHDAPPFVRDGNTNAYVTEVALKKEAAICVLPETYMNKSGDAVAAYVTHPRDAAQLIVVYDDIDLPLGTTRISFGRGTGGHRGVASIIECVGTKAFVRVRIGICKTSLFGRLKKPAGERAVNDFVLGDFTTKEARVVSESIEAAHRALDAVIAHGHERAMNTFN